MRELTEKQRAVLSHLAARDQEGHAPVTIGEIGEALGKRSLEWARDPINRLFQLKLADRAGYADVGAQCWRITATGRAILAEAGDER